jgi:hypothetical protein
MRLWESCLEVGAKGKPYKFSASPALGNHASDSDLLADLFNRNSGRWDPFDTMAEAKEIAAAAIAEPGHLIEKRASRVSRGSGTVEEADAGVLAEFGYKQELRRDWGLMHNFGISFSIIVSLSSFPASSQVMIK